MNIGIVVEGPDDSEVYPALIKRIDPAVNHVHCRHCGGRHKLKNKFVALLREFAHNPAAFGIRNALVIRDSDCNDPRPIKQELRAILEHSNLQLGFHVSFHVTKCKLESWLLADETAINTVSYRRHGPGGVQRIPEELEQFRDADQLYRRTLSAAGLQDTGQVMREIAGEVQLNVVSERCPRFREFVRKVRGEMPI